MKLAAAKGVLSRPISSPLVSPFTLSRVEMQEGFPEAGAAKIQIVSFLWTLGSEAHSSLFGSRGLPVGQALPRLRLKSGIRQTQALGDGVDGRKQPGWLDWASQRKRKLWCPAC